jgi:hypothetical protein
MDGELGTHFPSSEASPRYLCGVSATQVTATTHTPTLAFR